MNALEWRAGIGCHLAGIYVGAFGYDNDLLLLAPSRNVAQLMLRICNKLTGD